MNEVMQRDSSSGYGNLYNHICGLEGQLTSLGADVKPFNTDSDPSIAPLLQWNRTQEQGAGQDWEAEGSCS